MVKGVEQIQLCYITDRQQLAPGELLPRIKSAVHSGVDLVQIREHDLPSRELAALAEEAVQCSRHNPCTIIVNDRLDIALGAGADGVHLGGQSLRPEVVRREVAPGFLVGVSCHSLEDAERAETAGANYVLLGPIFETPSKLQYGPPLGLDRLAEVTGKINIPVLALGGITVERTKDCIDAGAAGVAGIRLFQDCPSVEERIRELRRQLER